MEQYNPIKVEHEILKFWEKNKIYEKQKKTYAASKKTWSFFDGPITANNPIGVHHAWGRTYKDLYIRFKAMQRFNIRRQPGFDCQGLWVEREVEKELNFKRGKDDIEAFGIKNFVEACRSRANKYVKKQIEQSVRLGMWMDWDKPYLTMSDKSNEYKWSFLKFCWDKGWLYKGKDVVPWCSRCTTASSKHDIVTEGYKEVTHTALFMKFPVKGQKNTFFLVWTTTPWTVPADVMLSVHPELVYAKVKQDKEMYILAKDRLSILKGEFKVEQELEGKKLANLKYEMPYKSLIVQKSSPHKVILWNDVSKEEGTGIVHNAAGCGPEDYQLGLKYNFPSPSPLNDVGVFVSGYDWLTGKHVSEANELITKDLQERGFLYKTEKYTHRYPHCFRCGTELVFRLVPEWYISMKEVRPKLIAENNKINWVPERGKIYEEDWLKNMGDWLISRKRYWGLPLPIWECDCGHTTIIGSIKELKKLAISGFPLKELHRPWIDDVIVKCPKCQKPVKRTLDTGDVWLDAGMVPFFTLDYNTNKQYFDKWYPADFVTECGPGQFRCWFYAMILHGVALTGKAPFKNVLTDELVKDENGKEMHKSWGNAIWFDDAADKAGSDIMRWLYAANDPGKELWFGYAPLTEKQKVLNVLWNFCNYIQPCLSLRKGGKLAPEDKWILSRIETLKKTVTESLEKLAPHVAVKAIEDFFLNDLSRGYGQLIREKLEEPHVVQTVYYTTLELLKLMSPFVPFLTEKLYQELYKKYEKVESIHLFEWPKPKHNDLSLEKDFSVVQDCISAILAARDKIKRGLRWPVKSVTVQTKDSAIVKQYAELIKDQTNVWGLNIGKLANLDLDVKPDFKKLGPRLGASIKEVAARLSVMAPKEAAKGFKFGNVNIAKTDLVIREVVPESVEAIDYKDFVVYLDKQETNEMLASGLVREVTRKVQDLRKNAGLVKKDRIALTISEDLGKFSKEIKDKCGAKELAFGQSKGKWKDKLEVKGKTIEIGIIKT